MSGNEREDLLTIPFNKNPQVTDPMGNAQLTIDGYGTRKSTREDSFFSARVGVLAAFSSANTFFTFN